MNNHQSHAYTPQQTSVESFVWEIIALSMRSENPDGNAWPNCVSLCNIHYRIWDDLDMELVTLELEGVCGEIPLFVAGIVTL